MLLRVGRTATTFSWSLQIVLPLRFISDRQRGTLDRIAHGSDFGSRRALRYVDLEHGILRPVGHTLTYRTADHSGIAGKLLNQGNSGDRVVAGFGAGGNHAPSRYRLHFLECKADPSQGGSPTDSVVNVASSVSIEPSVANATLRSAAFEADCAEWSMLEGSVNQQVNGTYLAAGLPFMFDYAKPKQSEVLFGPRVAAGDNLRLQLCRLRHGDRVERELYRNPHKYKFNFLSGSRR